jgi:transposase
VGRVGSSANNRAIGRCLSQLHDYFDVRSRPVEGLYRQGGVKSLHPIKPPGRPSRATPEFINRLKLAIQTNPMTLGYGFSTWSAARLAEHLARVTGIRFSDDQLQRLLHQEGFSIHRPKHTLKGKRDEKAYCKAKKDLTRLGKKR